MVYLDDFANTINFLKGNKDVLSDSVLLSSFQLPTKHYVLTLDPHFLPVSSFEKKSFLQNTYFHKPHFQPHIFLSSLDEPVNADVHIDITSPTKKDYFLNLTKTRLWLKKSYFQQNSFDFRSYQSHVRDSFVLVNSLDQSQQKNSSLEVFQYYLIKYIVQQKKGILFGFDSDVAYLKKQSINYFPQKTITHLNGLLQTNLIKKYPVLIDDILKSLYGDHFIQEVKPKETAGLKYIISDIDDYVCAVIKENS